MSKMIVERAVVEKALEQALEALEDLRVWYHKQMTAVFALRAQLAEPQEPDNGGKTGWPPGLLQDDCRGLSKWLASRPDARQRLREALAEPVQEPAEFAVSSNGRHSPVLTAMMNARRRAEAAEPAQEPAQEPQRKPLHEEEIRDLLDAEFLGGYGMRSWDDDLQVFRLAERAHGIGGEP